MYDKYLSNRDELPLIKRFAYLGSADHFNSKLSDLSQIAESENWNQSGDHAYATLFYYIINTFERSYKQEKIYIDEEEETAFFNTGLITPSGTEIYGYFIKNLKYTGDLSEFNFWYLSSFIKGNEKIFLQKCLKTPQEATYFEDYNELYFNPNLEIQVNYDHIFIDNYDRLPVSLRAIDQDQVNTIFNGYLSLTIKKIKRNNRIPVPQFYKDSIMFLIPVKVFGKDLVILALEKINNKYVANTVLTIEMAYNNARLLNKPESDWLLSEIK